MGVPFVIAPCEAEAQCASLAKDEKVNLLLIKGICCRIRRYGLFAFIKGHFMF